MSAPRRGAAAVVAAGILASRLAGLVRQRVIAHFFGQSTIAADALAAAFRIPNFLQNLFGEGVLSASFIPVYARLNASGDREAARKLAGAVGSVLALTVTIIVAIGVTATPLFVDLIVPGFRGEGRALAIDLVRTIFPGVGFLVMSAWCLGILNSHRRFLLSYAAPVVWNLTIIAFTILPAAGTSRERLVVLTAWGAVAGSLLQFLVQVPTVLRVAGTIPLSLGRGQAAVRTVFTNFVPAFTSRGVVQISAFLDAMIASLLPATGAVAVISNAQLLYMLPISLFGMSVAAAELPELSEAGLGDERYETLRARLARSSSQIAFFVVPSAVAVVALGDQVARLVFQSGAFTAADVRWVWVTLGGAALGLVAAALGRLLTSAYYALHDTRTPLRFALLRVILTVGLGYLAAIYGPRWLGLDPRWGTVGLTASAGVAGWAEFLLLRRTLISRLGDLSFPRGLLVRLWGGAAGAAAAAWLVIAALGFAATWVGSIVILAVYCAVYFSLTLLFKVPEAADLARRLRLAR
ncbi:MAG: murein biosynthesis integral membrane protein MurJ [Gemmatimonadota bacterium]